MTEIYVLGLDVSMNSTGWAVLGVKDGSIRLVGSGIVKSNAKKSHGKRMQNQREHFVEIVEQYKPTYVAREAGFSRHIKSTQVLFKIYGVAEEFFADFDLVEYAVSTIKKSVTGSGRADKTEVESAIRYELDLPDSFEFKSDDESDAVGVAMTMISKKGIKG